MGFALFVAGGFAETEHGEVTFPEISTTILEKICQYFYWSLQYSRFCSPPLFFFQILELMGAFLFSASPVCLTFRLPIQNKNFKLDAYLQYFDPNEGRCVPGDHIGRILALLFLIIFIFYLLSVDE